MGEPKPCREAGVPAVHILPLDSITSLSAGRGLIGNYVNRAVPSRCVKFSRLSKLLASVFPSTCPQPARGRAAVAAHVSITNEITESPTKKRRRNTQPLLPLAPTHWDLSPAAAVRIPKRGLGQTPPTHTHPTRTGKGRRVSLPRGTGGEQVAGRDAAGTKESVLSEHLQADLGKQSQQVGEKTSPAVKAMHRRPPEQTVPALQAAPLSAEHATCHAPILKCHRPPRLPPSSPPGSWGPGSAAPAAPLATATRSHQKVCLPTTSLGLKLP